MTLYDLNKQFERILEMAESGEFEEDVIQGSLECVEGDIEIKLDSYGVIVNELNDDIEKIDKELKRLTAKKKTLSNSVDYLKRNVMETLLRMDKRTVKGERFTWSIAKNGGKRPVIFKEGYNILAIPERFQSWDVKPDRDEIRQALENGEELDFATLGERGESLRLK